MEVITLARKSGLDPRQVCAVVGSGIAGSDYFRFLAASVLEKKPSPGGLGQTCKDVGLVINNSRRTRVPLVVASAAYQYFLSALGLENADSSELIRVLERMAEPVFVPCSCPQRPC
jgi:3-hydroxyisobutyrate dehydrogenase-like beta-hydroxyacid dehydrogenase